MEEGYGTYIDKERMSRDKVLPNKNCFCAFIKKDIEVLDKTFFTMAVDKECTDILYMTNYDKHMDDSSKIVAMKYSENKDLLRLSPCHTPTECTNQILYLNHCVKHFIGIIQSNNSNK